MEAGSRSLLDLLAKGNLEAWVPGAARLLTARCLYTVLVTAERLLVNFNLLPASLTFANLRVRASNNSGFLHVLNLVQSAPYEAVVDQWPYYPASAVP